MVPGCSALQVAGGHCQAHYWKLRRSGTLERVVHGAEWRERHSHPYRNSLGHLDPTPDLRPGHRGYLAVNVVNDIRQKALTKSYGNPSRAERRASGWWALTGEQAYRLIVADCSYCGAPAGWPEKRNGIDRTDCAIGYTPDNCVSACWRCNAAKNDGTVEEFRAWVDRAHGHLHREV